MLKIGQYFVKLLTSEQNTHFFGPPCIVVAKTRIKQYASKEDLHAIANEGTGPSSALPPCCFEDQKCALTTAQQASFMFIEHCTKKDNTAFNSNQWRGQV